MRSIGHEAANAAEVAGRGQATGDHHEHPIDEPLDLLEDVAARTGSCDPRPTSPRSRSIMCSRWRGSMPLNGSSRMRTGGSWTSAAATFDPLAHPLRVAADRAVRRHRAGRRGRWRVRARAAGSATSWSWAAASTNWRAGQEAVHRLALGDEADAPVELGVPPGRRLVELDGAGARRQEARHHVQQGRLARAVRPEQPGDAGSDVEGHVVDRHDVAVPARDAPRGAATLTP